jgi:tRNA(fMet)-specific endonuclease VapC
MLDTNFCIRIFRDQIPHIDSIMNSHASELVLSTIVVHELLFGAAKSARPAHHRGRVDDFASRLTVLDFDTGAAEHAGDIRATLARAGFAIGGFDALIAGHARSRSLIVVTENTSEFGRVAGLRCENWFADGASAG